MPGLASSRSSCEPSPASTIKRRAPRLRYRGILKQQDMSGTSFSSRWQFWIDRGGTFADVVARRPDGYLATHKLLSENPHHYRDAALAGIRHLLGIDASAPIPVECIDAVKM